ncbi:type II secretion system F family protein [Thiomicrospira microaerophila]|uniref:type II secretion system F family protein n=1 Tax=Thiomicrospira microaerophila TaxID=406020 RepID=UPI00200D110C|nr:type II secretion system F family protein [Thiomicrospira microaerophila]UQB43069.1 type II secretion system F family protein [Thiomicrospira microaerophila]
MSTGLFYSILGFSVFLLVLLVTRLLQIKNAVRVREQRVRHLIGLDQVFENDRLDESSNGVWFKFSQIMAPRNQKQLDAILLKLAQAGMRHDYHLGKFYALQLGFIVLVLIMTLGSVFVMEINPAWIVVGLVFAYFAPLKWLELKAHFRAIKINQSLPDFIDMTNVSLNAGLSWMISVQRVAKEFSDVHPEIADEFNLMLEQVNLGMGRIEALRAMEARVPTEDFKQLVQVLVQNERAGSSIAEALNNFARRLYQQREQRMAEKAAKASAKMAIVILPFLMLPYFIILLAEKLVLLSRGF